jgi:uncharacterized membrane protein
MLKTLISQTSTFDWLALFCFISCWAGYAWFAEHGEHARHGLVGLGHKHRLEWARRLLERETRIVDASLIGNLMSSVSFYANTTIYIIAGIFAVLGTLDKWATVAADLPFGHAASRDLLELKLLLLSGTFVFAYFKFTWSLRQFNLLSILVGAAPTGSTLDPAIERYAQKIAAVNTDAGDEFNRGIRAYYFGLAALTWIINPLLFITLTTAIIIVLYRRDFASSTRRALDN